jgi:predicted transcriptional regulator
MPPEGYAVITVSDDVRNRLAKIAEREFSTIPKIIQKMIKEHESRPKLVEVRA